MGALVLTLIGCVAFFLITMFEQLPVLGWLGWALSLGAWWAIAREVRGPLPAAVMGAITGLVGSATSWAAQTGNLFGFTTPPGERFGALFGFIGSSLGIIYWPLIGAMFCAGVALLASGGRRRAV